MLNKAEIWHVLYKVCLPSPFLFPALRPAPSSHRGPAPIQNQLPTQSSADTCTGFYQKFKRPNHVKVKSLSHVWLFATPWYVVCQAPPSMGFSRQRYWSRLPFPSPGELPDPGIEPWSPILQADSTILATRMNQSESESRSVMSDSLWHRGLYSPWNSPGQSTGIGSLSFLQGIFPIQGSNPDLPHCRWIL